MINSALKLLLWVKVLSVLAKKSCFFANAANISKIKRDLVLKGILSETTYDCVITCQISSSWYNSNEF